MNAIEKIAKTSEYLNTKKMVLVYGELVRQQRAGEDTFNARFECAKSLTKAGVKVKAFARYSKQGQTIIASVKQETRLIESGWVKTI